MSDPAELVERLRGGTKILTAGGPIHYPETDSLRLEAAEVILAQQAQIEALMKALQYGFDLYGPTFDGYWPLEMRREFDRLALSALGQGQQP